MANFKAGDRVIGVGSSYGISVEGRKGTIRGKSPASENIAVEFDEHIDYKLHSCDGRCKNGWYCLGKNLKLIENNQSIYITTKGNETIAVLKNGKETVKIAKAKCSPSDTFSFEIGAKLAVERLFGTDKPIVREVKRIAKVGEYIKIVKVGAYKFGKYQLGDIMEVCKYCTASNVTECNFNNSICRLLPYEYVVLENYQEESTPLIPEVGDKIRIVKTGSHLPHLHIGDIHTVIEISNGRLVNTDRRNCFGKSEYDEFEIISTPAISLADYTNEELLEELLRRE